ncbi:alpha/beta hydrolase [Planomonospora algeriensis]
MTERVEFTADGVTLVGDLRGPGGPGPHPALVLTGPFTGTRDQVTGRYAARLAEAGYVTLAFDHRNWGESGGSPRCDEDPQGKLRDLRAAVSLLRARPEVDGGRIGAVGICLGAGYALKFAAFDPRVRVFAGIAGAYNNPYAMLAGMSPAGYQEALASFTEVLERQDLGGPVEYVPAVAEEGEAAMPGDEPFAYYGTSRGASPHWRNEVTRASVRELITMDNMTGADFLGPRPGLIVHGVVDRFCSPEGAEEAYKRMEGPKQLVWLDTRLHIDLYDAEPYVTRAVDAVTSFLADHL